MINPIRLNRLKRLVEKIEPHDRQLSFEIQKMIFSIENRNKDGKFSLNEDVVSAFKKVADVSNDMALIGGIAVRSWVDTRSTDDVDFVVVKSDLSLIKSKFPSGNNSVFGYSVKIDGTDVDFLDASKFSWAKESIDTAVEKEEMGVVVKVVKPEYLLLFKIESSRNIDVTDILQLLQIDGVADKTRDLVYKYMPTNMEDFEQYVSMAENGIF